MPPFPVLIFKYSSKVCLMSKELKEMDSYEGFHPGPDAPQTCPSGLPQLCGVQPAQLYRWSCSLLRTVWLMYLNLVSLSPGEFRTTLLMFASLNPLIPCSV